MYKDWTAKGWDKVIFSDEAPHLRLLMDYQLSGEEKLNVILTQSMCEVTSKQVG